MNGAIEQIEQGGESLWSDAWRRLRRNRMAMACLAVIALFAAVAAVGEVMHWRYSILNASFPRPLQPVQKTLAILLRAEAVAGLPPPYQRPNLDLQYAPPGWSHYTDTGGRIHRELHIMGTDGLGRDVALRLVQGARIAFQVGIITALIAIPLAVVLGCLAGFFGGWVDDLVVWLYSTFACMPSLLFVLAISMIAGRGLLGVYLGIGLTTWVGLCRLIRAEVMKHKEQTYVRAARTLGLGPARIIFRHILPNIMHIIIVNFSIRFPTSIETEVIMSFLGIGVQGEPSWGIMISNARFRLWHGVWWEMTFATAAIFLTVLAFNLFGDALRDALDPRLRSQQEAR